jgi:glycosidase
MDDFIFGTLATDEARVAFQRAWWSGVTHRQQRAPRDPAPGQPITLTLTTGPTHSGPGAWVYWTTDGSDPQGEHGKATHGQAAPMRAVDEAWNVVMWDYVRRYEVQLPAQAAGTLVRYRLSAETLQGGEVFADGGAYYAVYVDDDPPPAWAQDAVVYHIFADRFHPGAGRAWLSPPDPEGFYGGTLNGITENLDYVEALGANVLFLSPIFPSPSHHGYDSTELFDIEPRLGTKDDFRRLLDAAHARQMRVLLDLVPNHISNEHPIFQQASTIENSPYREWFSFEHWPDQYATFFGVKTLPQLNLRYPPARDYMLDMARYWLEFGVDGYRVDYAIGPTPDFWADFRRATRAANPRCWTFGEVVDPPDSQLAFEGGLDGCLDFVLLEALRQSIAFGRWSAARLAGFLDRHEAFFPPSFSRPSFLDNHDMNRFLWAAQGDLRKLRLAALCQFSLAGPPLIYYGTEVGLSQERDVRQGSFGRPHESRLPMLWDENGVQLQNSQLFDYYRRLIDVRREYPALRHGARTLLAANSAMLAYARSSAGGANEVAAVLNVSSEPGTLRVPRALRHTLIASTEDTDAVRLDVQGDATLVTLPPLAGVLVR